MSVVVTYVSIPYVCNGNLPEHTYVHSGNLKYVSIGVNQQKSDGHVKSDK